MPQASSPIGVFDSGVGGLSVLRALLAALPHERFVYLADSANAPYGERGDAFVAARTHAISDFLCAQHHIKALVVACNTATAAAIQELRHRHPHLPLIGVEPAVKPAAQLTRTGRVGVMATRGTVASDKFQRLLASLPAPKRVDNTEERPAHAGRGGDRRGAPRRDGGRPHGQRRDESRPAGRSEARFEGRGDARPDSRGESRPARTEGDGQPKRRFRPRGPKGLGQHAGKVRRVN